MLKTFGFSELVLWIINTLSFREYKEKSHHILLYCNQRNQSKKANLSYTVLPFFAYTTDAHTCTKTRMLIRHIIRRESAAVFRWFWHLKKKNRIRLKKSIKNLTKHKIRKKKYETAAFPNKSCGLILSFKQDKPS